MNLVKGRFAPSPTGRMHLGNIFTALISWLSVKSVGGKWILRIEDLDPQRSRMDHARQIEDDLLWLGLEWDEGGLDGIGNNGPYCQSMRGEIYENALRQLEKTGLTYPCYCTRADILATQAPHESDGRIVYSGRCRPESLGGSFRHDGGQRERATRLCVPDREICFHDRLYGSQNVDLSRHCGDFVLRRSDGAWAYQLAVVVDDALMGVTEIVRGSDLLLSSAQQIYLYEMLGYPVPVFAHVPLLCNHEGRRLSKRDSSLSMEYLRGRYTPREVLGMIAYTGGLISVCRPVGLEELLHNFTWGSIPSSYTLSPDSSSVGVETGE